MITTHLGLDEREWGKGVYEVHGGAERRRRGSRPGTHAGEKREGGAGLCGEPKRAHGSGLCACEAYGRPVVKEVRGATESESIVSKLLLTDFEEFDRMAMGECEVSAETLRGHGPR